MGIPAIVELTFTILGKIAPTIADIVMDAISGGKTAEQLRNEPIEISIAFGGKEGEAVVVQRRIEADLPK